MAIRKNFSYSTVATAPSPATSGTSVIVQSGDGTKFTTGPCTLWPSGVAPLTSNAEIASISSIATDTFTIVRAQQSTTAQSVAVGWQIQQGPTAADVDVYNIMEYGAVGDGVTDDTAAIQRALNAAYTAGGGIVLVPAATFIIDPNPGLQVKTGVIFAGTGSGSVIKLINSSTHTDNMIKSESWVNVVVRDLTVDGNRVNQTFSSTLTVGSVTTATNTITITAHGLNTNDAIVYVAGTAPIGGLTDRTVYYVIRVDANNFKLAATSHNAVIDNTAVTLTSTGTGTQSIGVGYANTQYGVYFGSTNNSLIFNVKAINTTGVGIHVYNADGVTIEDCYSSNNRYHGYELEQDIGCNLVNSRGYANSQHGVLVSPGEVAGTGSKPTFRSLGREKIEL